jgi:hypothetical protein
MKLAEEQRTTVMILEATRCSGAKKPARVNESFPAPSALASGPIGGADAR